MGSNHNFTEFAMESGITVMIVLLTLMLMVPRVSVSVPKHSGILVRRASFSALWKADWNRGPLEFCWFCVGCKSEQSPEHGKTRYNTTFAAATEFKCKVSPHR